MDKVLRLLWFFSIAGFFVTFFYTYAGLEGMVEIGVYEDLNKFFLSKNEFFYSVFGIFIVASGIFLAATQFIKNIDVKSGFLKGSTQKRNNFLSSLYLSAIGINILLISFVVFVGFINSPTIKGDFNGEMLLYFGIPVIIFGILFMVYSLMKPYNK
ncbi:hypothetical protein OO013_10770 [Mangrovivirga sp. M17]|uniref:Uncharacterized protein n=1 Tax=Mangrovivirga halotolerans TaxID=2993936 RepID=A0ABT3RSX7_9BACT|nr:hypothetical protein [Mangrovivirga halotolerans]MCX2744352.1 hypothetical protein [Mangrovivirga halotolerans]